MILRRGRVRDHYVEDERSVVLVDETVLGLSPIATAILEAVPADAEVSLHAVTRRVVDAFGPPEGGQSAEALVRQQAWDLVAHRVLVEVDRARPGEDVADERRGAAVDAVRDALRHLRSGAAGRWTPPGSVGPAAFVAAAGQHHVVPYLAAHLDRLDLPGRAASELEATAARLRLGAIVLAAELSVALGALDAAGVRALAVKGVALAAQAYGDVTARGAGDLDLLVAPDDLPRAHRALVAAGWRPAPGSPVPGPSWAWRHLVRTGNELTLVDDRSEIDLHWHLAPTRSTFPAFSVLWSRREVVAVDGRHVPTLSRYDALAHSAGHAAKDGWRWLRGLLDVHTLMADGDTWRDVDRPLRPDQLVSVGLAARELGAPSEAPAVVALAERRVGDGLLARVRSRKIDTASHHRPASVPGVEFVRRLGTVRLTSGSAREAVRLLSRSTLPPWLTAQQTSTHGLVAVPRVLAHRLREVSRRASPVTARIRRTPAPAAPTLVETSGDRRGSRGAR